jgi:molybdopterin-guanine dinucleotide biosynthesis protein A
MTAQFLGWLLERARKASEWIVVPDALGGQQPLCAVYRRRVQALAEQALKQGDYKIGHMFSRAPTLVISETEMRDAGFSPQIFRNVNTAEEYEALVRDQAAILTKSGG